MAVKVFRNTDAGAPVLTGITGSLITVLDAVLVDGYNTVSVSSITRVGATATVTTAAAHGFSTGDSALIAGAAQGDYNIDAVVTVVSTTVFTYTVDNDPVTPATGTITVKRAPAGFGKPFSATNKAVYRSDDVSGLRGYLRVDDGGGSTGGGGEARVTGYEIMTGIDTGTGPFPTAAQNSDGYYWRKSSTTTAVARPWLIISDGKTMYYFVDYARVATDGVVTPYHTGAFGDFIPYKAADGYAMLLTGATAANSTTSVASGLLNQSTTITSTTTFSSSIAAARDYTAVPGARYVAVYGTGLNSTIGGAVYMAYPHAVDNGYFLSPILLVQGNPSLIRGRLPGAYEGWHGRTFNQNDIIDNVQGLSGRKLMHCYGNSGSSAGCILLDITGPWDA